MILHDVDKSEENVLSLQTQKREFGGSNSIMISYKWIYCSFLVDYRTKHQDSKAVKVVSINM